MRGPASGTATVNIEVSINSQRITVTSPEGTVSDRVSTGARGYGTKRGCYKPHHTNKRHWSRKYSAWMPNSVFYYGGFAIHQGHLPGYPASHGCVRTTWNMSAHVYNLVQKYGKQNSMVCVY